jgi:hypothetical protein
MVNISVASIYYSQDFEWGNWLIIFILRILVAWIVLGAACGMVLCVSELACLNGEQHISLKGYSLYIF